MSMVTEREKAKGSIVAEDVGDPELDATLREAANQRLDAIKEANRHREKQARINQGLYGILGTRENAPNNIAFIAVVLAFSSYTACVLAAGDNANQIEFWSRNADRSLAVALTALAYIFGRGSASS